jgi:hypothetical protein
MSPPGRISTSNGEFAQGRTLRKPDKAQLKSLQSAIGPDFEGEGPVEIGLDGMERVNVAAVCPTEILVSSAMHATLLPNHLDQAHVRDP